MYHLGKSTFFKKMLLLRKGKGKASQQFFFLIELQNVTYNIHENPSFRDFDPDKALDGKTRSNITTAHGAFKISKLPNSYRIKNFVFIRGGEGKKKYTRGESATRNLTSNLVIRAHSPSTQNPE